jgi:hypothetical protein
LPVERASDVHERQELEQYFFDDATLDHLARFVARFPDPCCLCTPTLGEELERRGVRTRTLDVDERFAYLRGFRHYDLTRPTWLGERYGIIVCDPPFLYVPLADLLRTVTILSLEDYRQPLLINYLSARATAITSMFSRFGLRPSGYRPGYRSIQNTGRNHMEFFSNLGPEYPLVPPPAVIR